MNIRSDDISGQFVFNDQMNLMSKFTQVGIEYYADSDLIDSLPCRFVCQIICEDNLRVAWEDESVEPPNIPPYIPEEERNRLKQLRLAEEEAKCPTYTMPGAFSPQ